MRSSALHRRRENIYNSMLHGLLRITKSEGHYHSCSSTIASLVLAVGESSTKKESIPVLSAVSVCKQWQQKMPQHPFKMLADRVFLLLS